MLLLILSAGCGAPSFATAREACEIPGGSFVPVPPAPLSPTCAETLGRIVGLHWESFDERPHEVPIEPETTTDRVIGGLYTLVAADVGTVDDLAHAVFSDELLGQEFPGGLVGGPVNAVDPAGLFWTEYLSARITRLEPDPEDGCYFKYVGDGVATLCFDAEELDLAAGSPPAMAAGLLHEAGHVNGPSHETDGELEWDAGIDGTYSVQARYLAGWLAENGAHDNTTCAAVAWQLTQVCARIQPNYGFAPCAEVEWCTHEVE